jgi:hypothetical protein
MRRGNQDTTLTSSNQPRDMCVRSHLSMRNLLDGLIHGEEECLCLLGARHYLDSGEEVKGSASSREAPGVSFCQRVGMTRCEIVAESRDESWGKLIGFIGSFAS